MATMSESCTICLEDFTEKAKTIKCEISTCSAKYHQRCFKKGYMSGTVLPKCYICDHTISSVYCHENLKPLNAYRDFVAKLDVEREKNKLPIAQAYIEDCEKADALEEEVSRIAEQIKKLEALQALKTREALQLRMGEKCSVRRKRSTFICPCPASTCNGFLNTKYVCTLCKTNVCSTCREILDSEEEHKCNEENVKSVDFIARTTKPCPKCGTRIHRPGGCDHMWCTKAGCNTGFSWQSGKVIPNSQNTNPFYYEWRRNQPGGLPREIDACALFDIPQVLEAVLRTARTSAVIKRSRIINHMYRIELPKLRRDPFSTNRDLAVKYLKGTIDERKWCSNLKARRKRSEIDEELGNVIETYIECSVDIFRAYYHKLDDKEVLERLDNLRKVLQKQVDNIFKVYKSQRSFSLLLGH
jgi:hypothetical protein